MTKIGGAPGIIPALDVDLETAEKIVVSLQGVKGAITGFKIGSLLVMRDGLGEICRSLKSEIPLILDMQKHATDIPDIIKKQVEVAAEEGIAAYIGSPLGAGSTSRDDNAGSLETFVTTCKSAGISPIIVMEMTQPGSTYFLRANACEDLAHMVCDLGVNHAVAPANRPERLELYRRIFSEHDRDIEIISPGVGPQKTGNPVKDAVEAVKYGADHLVIGRAIYRSTDPVSTVREIFEAIQEAFSERGKTP